MRASCLGTIIWLATAGWVLTSAAQAPDIARDQPGRWVIDPQECLQEHMRLETA
jgi:hypothetical protein